jgi:hypothetical protein
MLDFFLRKPLDQWEKLDYHRVPVIFEFCKQVPGPPSLSSSSPSACSALLCPCPLCSASVPLPWPLPALPSPPIISGLLSSPRVTLLLAAAVAPPRCPLLCAPRLPPSARWPPPHCHRGRPSTALKSSVSRAQQPLRSFPPEPLSILEPLIHFPLPPSSPAPAMSHPIYKNINRAIINAPGSSHAYIQQIIKISQHMSGITLI